ncbi:MAG: hypothetical protein KBA31_10010 [Alphaproteobacteria bacterium]|nr:hypothetical protein [Alphaproteobacteria bacterium]
MIRTLALSGVLLALAACSHGEGFRRPDVIEFGDSTAEIERKLVGCCTELTQRRIDPPFLSNVRERQMQIDCEAFLFLGGGRHVEFVIRDDRLVMVWLMVEPRETPAMIEAMTRAYGEPTGRNAAYVAFERDRAAWRFEPAEILFWAPELDADMRPDFH